MLCGPSRPGASAPAVTQPLAPLATVMAFSPAASIEMKAQPVRSGAVCSPPTSMPSPRRLSATAWPRTSSPTAPTMATLLPPPIMRDAATAWLAPLPPNSCS